MVETPVSVVNFSSDPVAEISRKGAVWTKVCDRLEVTQYPSERFVRGEVMPQPWERDVD
jgi:hypothetical protein